MFLQSLKFKHKFIGLSETWLNESNKLLYNLHGYNSIHKTRTNKRGGSVSLYIDENIMYTERDDLCNIFSDTSESIFIEIPKDVFKSGKQIMDGEIYRPPNNNSIESFNKKLEDLLKK